MLNDAYQNYDRYSAEKGTYGNEDKEETMQSLKTTLECVVDFMKTLQQDAGSQEEYDLVRRYARQISEM